MTEINIFPGQNIQGILTNYYDELQSTHNTIIKVHSGIYNQRVHIAGQNIDIKGTGLVVINNDLGAKRLGHNKTFYTATFLCEGKNICIENLVISNDAGPGYIAGQSIALYLNGDSISLRQCCLISYQDTLCLGPVIQINRDKTRTDTPVKDKTLVMARYKLYSCYIQGNVDYIFGGGSALFINCHINSIANRNSEGYICAPCTEKSRKFGFIFYNCIVLNNKNVQNIFLGRPWRQFAKAYFINCNLSKNIAENGWHYWGDDSSSIRNVDFRVYGSNQNFEQKWTINVKKTDCKLLSLIEDYFGVSFRNSSSN